MSDDLPEHGQHPLDIFVEFHRHHADVLPALISVGVGVRNSFLLRASSSNDAQGVDFFLGGSGAFFHVFVGVV